MRCSKASESVVSWGSLAVAQCIFAIWRGRLGGKGLGWKAYYSSSTRLRHRRGNDSKKNYINEDEIEHESCCYSDSMIGILALIIVWYT